jgi:hypothetical protein
MTTITRQQFVELLSGLKGATIIGLTVEGSDPARFKADYGRIGKTSQFSVMVNARYDKAKAKREGIDIDLLPPPQTPGWKQSIPGTCLSEHRTKGDKYIECLYLSGNTEYTLDGRPISRDEISEMLKPSKPTTVPWRTPRVDNVVSARINGIAYDITD